MPTFLDALRDAFVHRTYRTHSQPAPDGAWFWWVQQDARVLRVGVEPNKPHADVAAARFVVELLERDLKVAMGDHAQCEKLAMKCAPMQPPTRNTDAVAREFLSTVEGGSDDAQE